MVNAYLGLLHSNDHYELSLKIHSQDARYGEHYRNDLILPYFLLSSLLTEKSCQLIHHLNKKVTFIMLLLFSILLFEEDIGIFSI